MTLRSILHRRGRRFRLFHKPLDGVRYSADVVFTRAKVAILVDGCHWRGCPEHFVAPKTSVGYLGPKIAKNQRGDSEFDRLLKLVGRMVLHEWGHIEPVDIARMAPEFAKVIVHPFNTG